MAKRNDKSFDIFYILILVDHDDTICKLRFYADLFDHKQFDKVSRNYDDTINKPRKRMVPSSGWLDLQYQSHDPVVFK